MSITMYFQALFHWLALLLLLDQTVRRWNQSIAEIAARHDAVLVDLYGYGQELADHPGYISADSFHPSTAGYRRIAELVLVTLEPNVSTQP